MAVFLESKCHRYFLQIHAAGQYCTFYHFIFWRKNISVTMVHQHITTVTEKFSECSQNFRAYNDPTSLAQIAPATNEMESWQ